MTFDELADQMLSDPHHSLGMGATEDEIEHAACALNVPIAGDTENSCIVSGGAVASATSSMASALVFRITSIWYS